MSASLFDGKLDRSLIERLSECYCDDIQTRPKEGINMDYYPFTVAVQKAMMLVIKNEPVALIYPANNYNELLD